MSRDFINNTNNLSLEYLNCVSIHLKFELEKVESIILTMSEEVILLKDLKLVPDKYYNYTQALKNSKTPIVIDNGKLF